ncbi:MAG: pilus assembly protein PilM [Microgenomates group bacterium]
MTDAYFVLEIGESFIKLADAKKNGSLLEVASLGYAPAESAFYKTDSEKNTSNQANIIEKLVNSSGISKKNVALIIPDSVTYTQIISTPRLSEKELISAIKYQADQFIPMPIEETNIDIEILEDNKNEKNITVLIVAAPKKIIEKVQRLIEMVGLIPESIENELSSTARFLSEFTNFFPSNSDNKIIIANFGQESTSLYFFDPKLSLVKETYNFSVGYNLFLKELQLNTNYDFQRSQEILKSYAPKEKSSYDITQIITPALKDFVLEIKRFINLLNEKHRAQISNIYFTNEIFQFPALSYLTEKLLSLPAKELNPFSVCKNNPLITSHQNELSLFISTFGGNLR